MKTKKLLCCFLSLILMISAVPITSVTANAEVVGSFTVTGGTSGTDYNYADGTLTILDGANVTISMNDGVTQTTTDRIEVANGASANITLAGVNIDMSGKDETAAFKIADDSNGDVIVTLAEGTTNTLKSGMSCAGLQKNGDTTSGTLTINGLGTLTATGGDYGAGIGGGSICNGSNITISGGTVTATGGSYAAGIGGGDVGSGSNIAINGGTVEAFGGDYGAGIGGGCYGGMYGSDSNITISGGTVTATGGDFAAGIGGGKGESYMVEPTNITITISGGTVTATGGDFAAGIGDGEGGFGSTFSTGDGGNAFIVASSIGGYYYQDNWNGVIIEGDAGEVYGSTVTLTTDATLPAGKNLTIPEGKTLTVDAGKTLTNNGTIYANGTLNYGEPTYGTVTGSGEIITTVTYGDLKVTGDQRKVSYVDNTLTILDGANVTVSMSDGVTQTITDHIEVADGASANITLSGVNINVSAQYNAAAFKIADNSSGDVIVTLAEGTTNTLHSGESCAGLQKNGDINSGALTINGPGTLNANGGMYGAGIGGGNGVNGSNITISGGTVTATGGMYGAGIGGGWEGSGNDIAITGGTVTATGGEFAAGIGGGWEGSGSNITISGGTVTAIGGYSEHLRPDPSNPEGEGINTIEYLYGAGIGGGWKGSGNDIAITGGTVTATGGEFAAGIGGGWQGSGNGIAISGGTVTAIGGYSVRLRPDPSNPEGESIITIEYLYGAGIGGGRQGSGNGIAITGGTVTATGGKFGAGIGDGDGGSGGTFSTTKDGTAGNAFIVASSISDQSGKADGSWSGAIIEGNEGKVYGSTVALTTGATLPEGKTLTVPEGTTLNTGDLLTNNGTIYVDGTLSGSVGGSVYCLLTVVGGNASPTSTRNEKTYALLGQTITLTAEDKVGQTVSWNSDGVTVADNNTFTMPSKAVTVTAEYINAPTYTVTIPEEVTVGETATVAVSDVNVVSGSTLTVKIDNSANFVITSGEGANLNYEVHKDSNSGDLLNAGSNVLEIAGGTKNDEKSAVLAFTLASGEVEIYSGVYNGTLIFNIQIE